ncbi:MAG: hypothetical protein AAFR88_02325 [Pseudomonadota bacterium]
MTKQIQEKLQTGEARLVSAPDARTNAPRHQVEVDRNFELPSALYAATVGCYIAFLGLMLASFAAPMLAIPMVIFALFIVAGFGVPAIWTRLKGNDSAPLGMGSFMNSGIMTNTGRCSSRDAMVQMLILPALIVLWGCAIALIAAIVA